MAKMSRQQLESNIEHFRNKKIVEDRKKKNDEDYKSNCKKRLSNIISKKFDTTTIGILDILEQEIGYLWGHGLNPHEKSPEQIEFNDNVWQDVRRRILDHGNSNKRASKEEISQYTVSWDRYVTHFKMKKED